jgi:hypothetical protein
MIEKAAKRARIGLQGHAGADKDFSISPAFDLDGGGSEFARKQAQWLFLSRANAAGQFGCRHVSSAFFAL